MFFKTFGELRKSVRALSHLLQAMFFSTYL